MVVLMIFIAKQFFVIVMDTIYSFLEHSITVLKFVIGKHFKYFECCIQEL